MPRLRQVPRSEASREAVAVYDKIFGGRDPVAEPGTTTGTPGNWWTVFALVPDVLLHSAAGFAVFNSAERELPPPLRELAILRAGFAVGSRFVFSQHSKLARALEIPEEKIAAVSAWASAECFDGRERAVLAYVDELVLLDGRVQDETFERLRDALGERAILELTYVTASYRLHATISRALRLEYDDVDDPVAEVPAPPGFRPETLLELLR